MGYLDHTSDRVRLYLHESFAFWVNTLEAAIPLRYQETAQP